MQSRLGGYRAGWIGLCCILVALSGCSNERHLSFLNPQGPIAAAERSHFINVVAILGVFVALPIFVLTPWLAWRYRYGAKKTRRYDPKWKANLPLEIMTWAGPIVIVIGLGFLVWRYTHALDPYRAHALGSFQLHVLGPFQLHELDPGQSIVPAEPALHVQAIGYDWKWLFIYPDQGIASVGVMAFPVDKPVAMQLTSATVMQSLLIPALVGQIYAMGGMVTQLRFAATSPGLSLGMNTMYNGIGFHQQDFTAVAITSDNFKAWVQKVRSIGAQMNAHTYDVLSQRSTRAELAAALPQAAYGGNIYFTGVPAALFPAVVKATSTVPHPPKEMP